MKGGIVLIISMLSCQMAFGQVFEPKPADTLKLRKLVSQNEYAESIGYTYLNENYKATSKKDSIKHYEGESKGICSYNQSFEQGISYSVNRCGETSGMTESIVLPKMDLKTVKAFIELLFYDKGNSWVSDHSYSPDGPGCSYDIKQTDSNTVINVYCGC